MKIKSKVNAGGLQLNHNQSAAGLRLKAVVTPVGIAVNHNQTSATA